MKDEPGTVLADLIARFGTGLVSDPVRVEAMLRDRCSTCSREIFVLVNAQRQKVPADLTAPRHSLPLSMVRGFLAKRLENELALSQDAAQWAVDTWASALGLSGSGALLGGNDLDSHTQTSGIPVPLPACNDLDAAMTAICREHLAGQNVNERLGAVSALARSAGDQGGIELLVTALSDRSWRVRSAAYDALHSLNERAVPFLIGALQSDDDRIVWRAACLLGSLRADAAVDPLIALLVKNTSVCTVAVWALGEIGSPKAAEPLLALLKSNDTEIAGSAARALAKIGCPA